MRLGGNGHEPGDVAGGISRRVRTSRDNGEPCWAGVCSPRRRRDRAGRGGVELGVGCIGLRGAAGGLDPDDLEVGERGAELLLGERVTLLELAQDGYDLTAQPALLGVGTQQQTDV